MGAHLERAKLLYDQNRYDMAIKELHLEIASDPDDPTPHSLLALCLMELGKHKEATREAQLAIQLEPDHPHYHFVLGRVLVEQEQLKEATNAIKEALRLDPYEADYFSLLASIKLQQRNWTEALEAAEEGLEIDAEHIGCANLRAMALVKLNRGEEAGQVIDTTLAQDPENEFTHANQGWVLLERGEHVKAMEHFREALRLNPQLDWAKEGIVEALKAKHFIYRLLLRYFFWMSRLPSRTRWMVFIGGYLLSRVLRSMARTNPELQPLIVPLIVLYSTFAILTWIADPLFNLLLRFNRFGKMALSKDDIKATNWFGGFILAALVCFGLWIVTQITIALIAAIGCALMVIPVSATFNANSKRSRKILEIYTVALMVLGTIALVLSLTNSSLAIIPGIIFFFGLIIFQWIAAALMIR
jgi:tetratricopeptide (TPR) repeat protein